MPDRILPLTDAERERLDDLDLDVLSRDELRLLYDRISLTYPILLRQEPDGGDSDAFFLWEEDLEQLDDFLDELTERLGEEPGGNACG